MLVILRENMLNRAVIDAVLLYQLKHALAMHQVVVNQRHARLGLEADSAL